MKKITPLNQILLICMLLALISGCANKQGARHDTGVSIIQARKPAAKPVDKNTTYAIDAYDPWECFNRDMYLFNYYFDKYLFLPVVGAYEWIMPDYLEDRVSNIFDNVHELSNLTNNMLQLKSSGTAITLGRIAVNSTIGLAGMYDPATQWGMPEHDEDFGQTLGYYGVGAGPYLVLPVLGPSSLRDGTGLAVDATARLIFWNWVWGDGVKHESEIRWAIDILDAINARHNVDFRYYQSGSPFEYEIIRMLYLERRKLDIAK